MSMLHDCLHGCCTNRGTGTAVIKAKLAQQLLYLELKPSLVEFNGQGMLHFDSQGVQGRPTNDLTDPDLVTRGHHGVPGIR
jgi:hypothetical protein